MAAQEHGALRLSEGVAIKEKSIWDLLSDDGQKVWNCGSMNANFSKPLNGYFLPDPWSDHTSAYPEGEFDDFYKFVRAAVHKNKKMGAKEALAFGAFVARHGLSSESVLTIAKQLVHERRTKKFGWRRASVLDRVQWDVFRHYYQKERPQFSTFFINSVAHYQHHYWRNMEPEKFSIKPSEAEQQEFQNAILFGYQEQDQLLGKVMELAGNEASIWFCSALSQQAYTAAEASGGKHYYRMSADDVPSRVLGIKAKHRYEPVMSDQFYLRFDSEEEASAAAKQLLSFKVGDEQALGVRYESGKDVFGFCKIRHPLPKDAMLSGEGVQASRYADSFNMIAAPKSGFHHPEGLLWVRSPARSHRVYEEHVSLKSIAPAVLRAFGVAVPDYMRCPAFPSVTESGAAQSATA
jgi:predicted AlkP superfamily phosphohydrolase/phosphomutase